MANSFGAQRNGVLEILAISVVSLTAMKEGRHWFFLLCWLLSGYNINFLLGCEDLLCEIADLRGIVFLVNHIETSDELS